MIAKLIFNDKKFSPLFWTQFAGALNDNFFKNALAIILTYKSVSLWGADAKQLVAMAGGVFILPFFLFSATAGQIADKYERSKLIKLLKITELIIMCFASFLFIIESYQYLMFVLFLMGTQSAFFGPLKYGTLPELVDRSTLVTGNAAISMGTFVSILLGTILGGQAAGMGELSSLLLTIGLVGFALLGIIPSLKFIKLPPYDSQLKVDYTFFKSTYDILKLCTKDKKVFKALLGISWFWAFGAALLSLIPTLAKDVYGGAETVATLFLAAFTIGMGIGCGLCEKLSRGKVDVGMVAVSLVGMSFFLVDLWWVSSQWQKPIEIMSLSAFLSKPGAIRSFIDLVFITIFGGMFIIPQFSYIQEQSPREIIARIIAGNNIMNSFFMVFSAVGIIVLHGMNVSTPEIFLYLGAANFILSFILYIVYMPESIHFNFWWISSLLYKIEVKGQEHMPKSGSYIVAVNHVTFIDWMIAFAALRKPIQWVIDFSYYNNWFIKFWARQGKCVPIASARECSDTLKKAFITTNDYINKGAIIGIFPEGFLCRNGEVGKIRPGVKKIARENNIPVLPITLDGLWGSFFSHSGKGVFKKIPRITRRKVTVEIHPIIEAQDLELDRIKVAYEKVFPEGRYSEA